MVTMLPYSVACAVYRLFQQGISLSTHYSGMGSVETALEFVLQALHDRCSDGDSPLPQVNHCHAADSDPQCRLALKAHSGPSKPKHVFGDFTNRVPASVMSKLTDAQKELEQQYHDLSKVVGRSEAMETMMDVVMLTYKTILKDVKVNDEAWCFVHNDLCNTFDIDENSLHLNFVTPTCVEHSLMNKFRLAILGVTTLP